MVYDMKHNQLIQSLIKDGHVYETYIAFCFDNCINDGVDYLTLEYDRSAYYLKNKSSSQ